MRKETIAVHSGFDFDPATHAVATPIYQTVAYAFDSAEHGAALFNLEAEGYRYSRIANPTNAVLEKRVTELEGGAGAVSLASGQAALYQAIVTLADGGGDIVATPQLYGTTHTLFSHILPRQGIQTRFAQSDSAESIGRLIGEQTRAVFCESVGNPAGNVCDIEAIARVAHAHGVPLVVDNTVATPILLRPIEFGADVVVHSLTKFMGGHGTSMGGAVVDSGRFDWTRHKARFPMFNEPDRSYHGLVYTEHFGASAYIARLRNVYQRTMGSTLSPFNAFMLLQGIETVALRIERHVENARRVAEFLRADPRVAWVSYAGFPDSPYFALTEKYLAGRPPSLLTFGVQGGLEGGKAFYNRLRLIKRLVNIGDVKSLACHPASTTHRQMNAEELASAGIRPETIRLCVGIEHVDDIVEDLDQALGAEDRRWQPSPARRMERRTGPSDGRPLVIGLVNNMPDAALEATEHQFGDLLSAASPDRPPTLRFFCLKEIERGERARAHMRGRYLDIDHLPDAGLDGLIVTGAEPRAATFDGEVYWESLARVIDWTQAAQTPAVWSCLAAHAAVWRLDAIPRRRLARKLSGVFELQAAGDYPLLGDTSVPMRAPHSRLNGLDEDDLRAAGYQILTRSGEVGVDAFVKPGPAINLFFQGHPEYDADCLAREYLRDVSRFLAGEQAAHPLPPSGFFEPRTALRLAALAERAQAGRDHGLMADYSQATAGSAQGAGWRPWAVQIYKAWLDRVDAVARADPATTREAALIGP